MIIRARNPTRSQIRENGNPNVLRFKIHKCIQYILLCVLHWRKIICGRSSSNYWRMNQACVGQGRAGEGESGTNTLRAAGSWTPPLWHMHETSEVAPPLPTPLPLDTFPYESGGIVEEVPRGPGRRTCAEGSVGDPLGCRRRAPGKPPAAVWTAQRKKKLYNITTDTTLDI